jgi:protein SCO1/2
MPTVLLFADYSCRHICGPGVTLTAGALHDAGLRPGRDYRMIVIGLDGDGPIRARTLIADRLTALPGEARHIALLTGAPATIAQAELALGYHAVYDPQADQFAHDASLYVFAPTGALAAILPETATIPARLAAAIGEARTGTAYVAPAPRSDGGVIGRIDAICYGLAASHGVYARPVIVGLRAGGVAICLTLAAFVLWSLRRHRRGLA